MISDCSCDFQGQNCKAYCQLLQPVAHTSDRACSHWHQRTQPRNVDPLRELNRCCDYAVLPHGRHHGDQSFHEATVKKCRSNNLLPVHRTGNPQFCSIPDTEWSSACVSSKHAMTFEEREMYSANLRQSYIEEMEALKVKLNQLKNGVIIDGKRCRQRSESEPGFASSNAKINKRTHELSPPLSRRHYRRSKPSCSFQRETRSVPPRMGRVQKQLSPVAPLHRVQRIDFGQTCRGFDDEMDPLSEGEASICGEDVSGDDEATGQEDDDFLAESEATSNGSNTPSHVGKFLGSICLNEKAEESACVPLNSFHFFRPSLFSNVPPFVQFVMHDYQGYGLPPEISKLLKWKLSTITPVVIRRTLVNSGFRLIKKSNDWTGQWGKHMTSFTFRTLKDFQKLNHFPGTFQIGRKDKLWKNLSRLMLKHGKKEFGFIPTTYILPQDNKRLRIAWETTAGKGQWIIKPPAAARGTGIKVVHRWCDIPKNKPLIVQKYIGAPYLINGSKFDLRLYVLMTSIDPLRIYLYDDGLVRFASVKYSDNVESLSNRFMHLTNYSINKLSNQYCANEDATSCQGHKWTLKTLWGYLEKEGVNVKSLQKNMTDLVIKTIISGEYHIQALSKQNLTSRYCSYELFGIDVLLDSALRPWLLEVNISPSLHSSSPLDLAVKGPLVRELLNIVGFQVPAKLSNDVELSFLKSSGLSERTSTCCYDKRLYTTLLSRDERIKRACHINSTRNEYLASILENLTADDVRHLLQYEDELTQLQRFEKVFPTTETHSYHNFFKQPRYYNMLLDAWECKYQKNRQPGIQILENLCQQRLHLEVPFTGGKTKEKVYIMMRKMYEQCKKAEQRKCVYPDQSLY